MNESELKEEFERRKPYLEKFGEWVTREICIALEEKLGSRNSLNKFLKIPPNPRVKETDSFLEKALVRKPKQDPLHDITDQVGVRFVVLLLEDIELVGNIIKSGSWSWKKDRDHEQERLEKPDYFAYQSDHYIVYSNSTIEFEGISIPENTSCEVQIRTILQHAYAEMAHHSDYKPSIQLPIEGKKRIKRSLAKGSALIETTDDVFREIKKNLDEYDKSICALLECASKIYESITGEKTNPSTAIGSIISDNYREFLKDLTPNSLEEWAKQRNWLAQKLMQKRSESVFFRDSVVVLIGWLITEYQMSIPTNWPFDLAYLEDCYIMFGISTSGLF